MTINKPQVEEKFGTNASKMSGKKVGGLLAATLVVEIAARKPPYPYKE